MKKLFSIKSLTSLTSLPSLFILSYIIFHFKFTSNAFSLDKEKQLNKYCVNSTSRNEVILASYKTLEKCNKIINEYVNYAEMDIGIDIGMDIGIDIGMGIDSAMKINTITKKMQNLYELVKNYKKLFNNYQNNFKTETDYSNICILFNNIKILSSDIQKSCS